jgi:hypothetical protein
MPTGKKSGANELRMPGGKLSGGYNEAIIDQIPKVDYQIESIKKVK